jgi:hypothetical protein
MKTAFLTLFSLLGMLAGCTNICEDGTTPFVFDEAFVTAVVETDVSVRSAEMLALNRVHVAFRDQLEHRGIAPSSIPGYRDWSRRIRAATEVVKAQVLDCRDWRRDGSGIGSVRVIEQASRLEMLVDECIHETVVFLVSAGFTPPVDPAPGLR